MKLGNYLVVFCLLVLSISMVFVNSCVDKKVNNNEDSKAESEKTEPSIENPPLKRPDVDPNVAKGTAYKNLLDDKNLYFEDYKEYVLLVDFWATWCPPCRTEIPWFIELHDKYKDQKFAVIGISLDRSGEGVVKKFINQFNVNYPVIMATNEIVEEYEEALGGPIRSIPTTFIKNKAGAIAHTHIGIPRAANPKDLFEEEILKLLNE